MPAPAPNWSAWTPLTGAPALTSATLAELVDGGQAFRWQREPDGIWTGVWSGNIARLRLTEKGTLDWSAPDTLATHVRTALPDYLFGHDSSAALDALPWRSDPHLAHCLSAVPGLTILRQPFDETLLGFLCSATKQIVQIKQMMALLATRLGQPLAPGIWRLPTWAELAARAAIGHHDVVVGAGRPVHAAGINHCCCRSRSAPAGC